MKPIEWTVTRAANEFGVSASTLTRGLIREGHEIRPVGKGKRGQTFRTADIVAALYGDEERARTRDLEASARLKEQKFARNDKRLCDVDEVVEAGNRAFGVIRSKLLSSLATVPTRLCPGDPQFGREAYAPILDDLLASCRDGVFKAALMNAMDGQEEEEAEGQEEGSVDRE